MLAWCYPVALLRLCPMEQSSSCVQARCSTFLPGTIPGWWAASPTCRSTFPVQPITRSMSDPFILEWPKYPFVAVLCRLNANLFVDSLASHSSEEHDAATIYRKSILLERTFEPDGGKRSRHSASLHARPQLPGAVK